MKKVSMLLLITVTLLYCSVVYTESSSSIVDLSELGFQELIDLRQQIDMRIVQTATQIDHSQYTYDGFSYASNGKEIRLNLYEGTNPVVVVPTEINSLPVTQIHPNAFKGNKTITSVVFTEYIAGLESEEFFSGCRNLTSVVLPEGMTIIPNECFYGCANLTSVTLPSTITTIGRWAFHDANKLTHIDLHEGITTLNSAAFQRAGGLEGVIILPTTLTTMKDYAFSRCERVSGYVIQSNINIPYASFGGDRVQFVYVREGYSVSFGSEVFESALQVAILPASVTSIADDTFADCNRLTIICPAGSYAESYAQSHFIMCDTEHYEQYIQEYEEQISN